MIGQNRRLEFPDVVGLQEIFLSISKTIMQAKILARPINLLVTRPDVSGSSQGGNSCLQDKSANISSLNWSCLMKTCTHSPDMPCWSLDNQEACGKTGRGSYWEVNWVTPFRYPSLVWGVVAVRRGAVQGPRPLILCSLTIPLCLAWFWRPHFFCFLCGLIE